MKSEKLPIVTLNGRSCCGKSHTGHELHKLYPTHNYFSIGDYVREMAKQAGFNDIDGYNQHCTDTGTSFDEIVDGFLKEIGQGTEPYIIDSRLGALFIPRSFKVLLTVSPIVGARRRLKDLLRKDPIGNAHLTEQDVLQQIQHRDDENSMRYLAKYGFDGSELTLYDIVIDTEQYSIAEVVALVHQEYAK